MSGTANITIIIGDVDDNCPVFERQKYETTLEENAPFGTFVLTVKATDRDTGRNAELDYGILESNDRGTESYTYSTFTLKHISMLRLRPYLINMSSPFCSVIRDNV